MTMTNIEWMEREREKKTGPSTRILEKDGILNLSANPAGLLSLNIAAHIKMKEGGVILNEKIGLGRVGWLADIGTTSTGKVFIRDGETVKFTYRKQSNNLGMNGSFSRLRKWATETFNHKGSIKFKLVEVKNGIAKFERVV